ncbi:MAG: hypothetical protein ACRCTJ_03940 [Brevinema sp.]
MTRSIYGYSNSGKSTSIRFIAQILLNDPNYTIEAAFYQSNQEEISKDDYNTIHQINKDIICIFKGENKIILISSGGDTEQIIKENLKLLQDQAKKIWNNWDQIKNDSSQYLLITGVKYGKATDSAKRRANIVDGFSPNRAVWVRAPYSWNKKDIAYEYIYKTFACAILAEYDDNYKKIIDQIKL